MSTASRAIAPHSWSFARTGGVDQVVFRSGDDIANLPALDQKLWMVLAMPTRGVEFDSVTADLLDEDKDGRIRPPEILAAVRWAQGAFHDLGVLMKGGDSVPLSAIKDPAILAGARRLLANLGKADATAVGMDDLADDARIFASTLFNGDGVVPADAADDAVTRKAIEDVIAVLGPVPDRSGKPGVNQANLDLFFAHVLALLGWAEKGDAVPLVASIGAERAAAALGAVQAVRTKVDDYFARCRLAAYDGRALAALNREEKEFLALAAKDLTITSAEIAALPLARIEAGRALPLSGGLNPAWEAAVAAMARLAVEPLIGARAALSDADWAAMQARLAPFEAWKAAQPGEGAAALGIPRLRELASGGVSGKIAALIAKDSALAPEILQLAAVEKLVRFQRDFYRLLRNFVNFADFYGRAGSVFQAGTLFLDARACDLCIAVADAAKHAALAGLSGAYLAYCDLSRPGGLRRSIVAVFTDGDSDHLIVGRNGVFYDRKGQDWDATIAKVVANPIGIREAFWLPYKKLVRFIEEQVSKRALAAETASTTKLTGALAAAPAATPPPAAKKLDLGTIALIGTAVGGMSALVGGFLQSLFGLGIWLPLGVVGIVLLISGPSMVLAWLKLRTRNLGPILDANGWAINTRALMNVPFGAALTRLARLPAGSTRLLEDPYAERRRPWKLWLVLAAVGVLFGLRWFGWLNCCLPAALQR